MKQELCGKDYGVKLSVSDLLKLKSVVNEKERDAYISSIYTILRIRPDKDLAVRDIGGSDVKIYVSITKEDVPLLLKGQAVLISKLGMVCRIWVDFTELSERALLGIGGIGNAIKGSPFVLEISRQAGLLLIHAWMPDLPIDISEDSLARPALESIHFIDKAGVLTKEGMDFAITLSDMTV